MSKLQENILNYSTGERVKSLLIMVSNVVMRFQSLPIKPEGKEVIGWILEAVLNEISLCLNVSESIYLQAAKEFVGSVEQEFLKDNIDEAIAYLSNAISKATTQASQAFEELEEILKRNE